ncbi:MAG: serine protease [Pirellulaceae bacterium]|nr:serine protease [Pirellulaceae bacterium]
MSSPPVYPIWPCAAGFCRVRLIRARSVPVGFLVLAASFFLAPPAAIGQFPIKQIPGGWGPRPATATPVSQPGRQLFGNSGQGATPPPAVARITVPEKDGISLGSGTLIDARGQFGLVITNWHVVRDAAGPISVQFPDGFQSVGMVVKTDQDWDLAALSIRRPTAQPLPITAAAPQLGEVLTIAGYGAGDFRFATGKCTQYLAPGEQFPYELIELAAEARQGDSGGPILNSRGEICGVLFGSGPGYTSGSYGGRVRQFLATVVPGGEPGSDTQPPASNLAAAPPVAPVPHSTALHQPQPATPAFGPSPSPPSPPPTSLSEFAAGRDNSLTPVAEAPLDPLLTPPPQASLAGGFEAPADEEVDPRAAVERRVAASLEDHSDRAPASIGFHSPLPPRDAPAMTAGTDLNSAPPDQLLAAAWKKLGGPTALDQGKTILAAIGILTLLVQFWRISRRPEPEVQEE